MKVITSKSAAAKAGATLISSLSTVIAVENANIVLVKSTLKDVVSLINLSKRTYRTKFQNLWRANGYNILAINASLL